MQLDTQVIPIVMQASQAIMSTAVDASSKGSGCCALSSRLVR